MLVVTATSDGLMGTTKKGPGEPEEKGDRAREEQGTKEASHFRNTQSNHYGQTSPRWRLKSERVWEGAWDGKGSYKYRFFTPRHVPAHGVFVVCGAPFPFAFSSSSPLQV
jgi:hypothetical protein